MWAAFCRFVGNRGGHHYHEVTKSKSKITLISQRFSAFRIEIKVETMRKRFYTYTEVGQPVLKI